MNKTREVHKFWAILNDDIHHVDGYSCGPDNPDYWWIPDLGYSMRYGHDIFETKEEAKQTALNRIEDQIRRLNDKKYTLWGK